ncbi:MULTISPECIES: hypothetical protein [Silvimonas]|uniref:hypothetical protein n=1 Tax=Silvimonas TaxID=300264 RepID=UPI0024B3AFAC|nr:MULTISPECIES: hypothetical protein [Silvimonas]MDR3428733.1 hypothetical protein [Silvimonas sp.]
MAFDVRQIKPEYTIPAIKPAWVWYVVLFLLIVGGGAALAIYLWPKGEPTQTDWFWTRVVVFPVMAWLALVLLDLGVQQNAQDKARDRNRARQQKLATTCAEGGRSLPVLASAFVFSCQPEENTAAAVVGRTLRLVPRQRVPEDRAEIKARWLEHPERVYPGRDAEADIARQKDLLSWVFAHLIQPVAGAVEQLPAHIPLHITLATSPVFETAWVEAEWQKAWQAQGLRDTAKPVIEPKPPELAEVDLWLDGKGQLATDGATLLCVVQLNALLDAAPAEGSAEAGVAVLLLPFAMAQTHQVVPMAYLHRPETPSEADLSHGLYQTLLWGHAKGADIASQWLTGGAQSPLQRALVSSFEDQKVEIMNTPELAGQHDIDQAVGQSGIASQWLAVALAADHAGSTTRKQLLSLSTPDHMTLAIVAPHA